MQKIKEQLFTTLEDILSTASDIHIMTQNQETIILHSSDHTILSELAKNKQEKILRLDALEKQFESIYTEHKGIVTDRQDIIRLQTLVSKIMETKEGISKAEAVKRFCAHLGISPDETIAFGDNFNDVEMLEAVGRSYVMGNAPEEILDRFPYHTADNDHDGIADVLEQIF